jgi:hypothetical protein
MLRKQWDACREPIIWNFECPAHECGAMRRRPLNRLLLGGYFWIVSR